MSERGILFSAPMVRALFADTKTQTRRAFRVQPKGDVDNLGDGETLIDTATSKAITCPYGVVGDRLWVRETHARFHVGEGLDRPVPECVAYRATCAEDGSFDYVNTRGEIMGLKVTKWTPAIHMPRWASRILLEITEVRAQRLHEITEADCWAEGIDAIDGMIDDAKICAAAKLADCSCEDARAVFAALWCEINGADSWKANPWIWAITFKRVQS